MIVFVYFETGYLVNFISKELRIEKKIISKHSMTPKWNKLVLHLKCFNVLKFIKKTCCGLRCLHKQKLIFKISRTFCSGYEGLKI